MAKRFRKCGRGELLHKPHIKHMETKVSYRIDVRRRPTHEYNNLSLSRASFIVREPTLVCADFACMFKNPPTFTRVRDQTGHVFVRAQVKMNAHRRLCESLRIRIISATKPVFETRQPALAQTLPAFARNYCKIEKEKMIEWCPARGSFSGRPTTSQPFMVP